MSYQIKSTPYFRRMLSTSRKNGQLQKLKEEYDRLREFNERTIEMKMRQVRLKRLFREIEEIKESSTVGAAKRHRMALNILKSEEERRLETLIKAKELGKEFSRWNAQMQERRFDTPSTSAVAMTPTPSVSDATRARIAKRISYGNEISRRNLQQITQSAKKRPKPGSEPTAEDVSTSEKQLILRNRLDYGNSRSSVNMSKIPKRHAKHKIATEQPKSKSLLQRQRTDDGECNSDLEDSELQLRNTRTQNSIPVREPHIFRTFEQLQSSKVRMTTASQSLPEDDSQQRARDHWHKMALTVRNRIDVVNSQRTQQPLNEQSSQSLSAIRSIASDMHLPQSHLSDKWVPSQANHIDADEMLINYQSLLELTQRSDSTECEQEPPQELDQESDPDQPRTSYQWPRQSERPPQHARLNSGYDKPIPYRHEPRTLSRKVQNFVKIFEPYVREVAEKEAYDAFGVKNLRSIFAHQLNE